MGDPASKATNSLTKLFASFTKKSPFNNSLKTSSFKIEVDAFVVSVSVLVDEVEVEARSGAHVDQIGRPPRFAEVADPA